MKKIKILHLEDNSYDSEFILSEIESKDYEVDYTRVDTEKAFIDNLEKNTFDIILADNNLPTYDGISALKICSERYPDYPFIFVSGTLGEEIAIDMLKRGASDYILKHNLIRLVPAIEHAIEEGELKRQKIKSEKKYQNLVNTASDVIFTLDKGYGIFTSINPAFERLTGFKINEFIGKPFTDIVCEEDTITALAAYETVMKDKITKTIVIKIKTEWGDIKHSEITGQPLFEDDKLTGILCIGRDITDEIKAEEKIKVLSTAIEQGPTSIFITDLNGNIEYVNPRFADITGYLPVEILGKNPKILKSGETSSETYKTLWDTIIHGGVWHGELKNKKKNGEYYWESESISPVKNIKGEITHFIAIKEDITDKKMKERELIAAKEKAEESNRLKTCFLANMSHELRTPMIAILGFTEILSEMVEDTNIREYINLIYEGGERLMETLNLILNLSLIESEKMTVKLSKVDIVKEINDSVNFFRKTAEKKNLYLKAEANYDSMTVNLNQGIIRQVMYNLINNAIKFTNDGGITVYINKESINDHDYASIRIKDTGIGIPENKQDVIWEEYRQVSEGLNRSFEGTGLGLTITKNFVSKLGGEIFLEESEVQKGSTFKILFPLNGDAQTVTEIIKQEIKKEPLKIENLNPEAVLPRVLYVEDDPKAVRVVEIFLKCLCEIDTAQDSMECLRKVKENKYEAIIMDINLGKGLDGIQTAGLIRKIPGYENIPIIANTAYAMGEDKEEFLQKGCTHYISKPFKASEMRELMKNVLKRK